MFMAEWRARTRNSNAMEVLASNPVLAVNDLDRSAAWYRDVLGCDTREADPGNWIFCRSGSIEFMLGRCDDAPPASTIGDHSYIAYLRVDDVDAFHRRAADGGAEIMKPPTDEPWGMREFAVRSPDGHRFMLAQPTHEPAPLSAAGPSTMAEQALTRARSIAERLPGVEITTNALGCYFAVRRKNFAQICTIVGPSGSAISMVVVRPAADEREAFLAIGHPYLSRGPHDNRHGRIAVVIEPTTDWDEIAELMTDSYRRSAPKKFVAMLDE